ncbi:hypothetical protein ACJX0J_007550, partial [Zea mays]
LPPSRHEGRLYGSGRMGRKSFIPPDYDIGSFLKGHRRSRGHDKTTLTKSPHRLTKLKEHLTQRIDGILGAKDQRTVTSKSRPRLLLQGDVHNYVQRVPDKLQVTKKAVLHVFPAALPQSLRLSCLCPRRQLSGLDVPFHAAPTSTHEHIPGPLGAITIYGNQQTAHNIERDF